MTAGFGNTVALTVDLPEWERFVYNLSLIAPGKGEAKKTVSRGFIRLAVRNDTLWGYATDDILSVAARITPKFPVVGWSTVWTTVEYLKDWGIDGEDVTLQFSPEFSEDFDRKFWTEHVQESIFGDAWQQQASGVNISPDRLRKFSLLKPQKKPVRWWFVEWADRDIIRWEYDTLTGIYVPLDHELKEKE